MSLTVVRRRRDDDDDDPHRRPRRLSEQAGQLFDLLEEMPDGVTYRDCAARFGWSRRVFLRVVQYFRDLFKNDPYALVCTVNPADLLGPWIYKVSPDTREWHNKRMQQVESQLETMEHVIRSALKDLDGRSALGRRARIMQRYFVRMLEDLADLREQAAL